MKTLSSHAMAKQSKRDTTEVESAADQENQSFVRRLTGLVPARDAVNFRVSSVLVYVFVTQPPQLLTRIARTKYIDRVLSIGVATLLISMIATVATFVSTLVPIVTTTPEPTAANDPTNVVAIPGVNEFLPVAAVVYIIVGLVIAIAAHELSHAVGMVFSDVSIKEIGVGLLAGVFPVAAYVKPDEDELAAASRQARLRILSAGVFSNLLLGGLGIALLLLPLTASPSTAFAVYFDPVLESSVTTTVGDLGVLTNLSFWLAFLNINFAMVNALPVATLDGGRVLGVIVERSGTDYETATLTRRKLVVGASSATTIGLFSLIIVGPYIL